jgi:hypothetical protein
VLEYRMPGHLYRRTRSFFSPTPLRSEFCAPNFGNSAKPLKRKVDSVDKTFVKDVLSRQTGA